MTGTALILGGNGRFGRSMAEALWNAGWRLRLFDRGRDDLHRAAQGTDVIVNGWNPAYPDWAAALPGQTAQVIRAARSSGATVLFPGNVYVFGRSAPEVFGPGVPHGATNPLGRLRAEAEAAYREAGVPVIVLRAGDFLDTEASGNWFDRIMAPSLARGILTSPGDPEAVHAWAFLPDMARAAVGLLEKRAELPRFADIAFPGYAMTGREMAALCGEVLGREIRVKRMNWLPLYLARPFWRMAPPLLEMRYLWNKPHRLGADSFEAALPGFRATAPVDALHAAIAPVLRGSEGRPRPAGAARDPGSARAA